MHRLGLIVLVAALAGAMLFVLLRQDAATSQTPAEATNIAAPDGPAPPSPEPLASTSAAASVPTPQRDQVEPANAPRGSDAPSATVAIVGRCLGADGEPLSDAHVAVSGSRHGNVSASTGADGRFALRVSPIDKVKLSLLATHRAHLAVTRQWTPPLSETSLDAGDLHLPRGCVVSGTVRESDGKPAAKLALRAVPAGEWANEPRHASAQTGEDGTFSFDAALAPGRWVVRADPRDFVVPALLVVGGDPAQRLDLQLAAARHPRRISGTVVDRQGEPVVGVTVMALEPAGVQPVVSGQGGSFELVDWLTQGEAAALVLQPTDGGAPDPATRVEWGRGDVRLEWRRGTSLHVQARWVGIPRDPQGHISLMHPAPVKAAPAAHPLASLRQQPQAAMPKRTPLDATDKVVFHDLLPGAYVLFGAEAKRYASKPCQVQIGGTPSAEVTVDLVGIVQRKLIVQWPDGTPADGAAVRWSALEQPQLGLLNFLAPFVTGGHGGLTDGRGAVTLSGPAGTPGRVSIMARFGPSLTLPDVALDAQPEPWLATLPAGGTIEIIGLPATELRQGAIPVLIGTDGARWPAQRQADQHLTIMLARQPQQPVRYAGVPPGTWRIAVLHRGQSRFVGEVRDLAVGELRQVKIAVPEFKTATVQGQVRWNGRPHALGVTLRRLDGGASGAAAQTEVASSEQVASPGGELRGVVPVGRYRAYIMHPLTYHYLPIAGEVELRADAPVPLDLHLQTRPVRLRVLRGGQPWRGAELRLVLATGEQLDCAPTDVYGVTELALPYGMHACSLLADANATPLGSLGVTPGEGPMLTVFER